MRKILDVQVGQNDKGEVSLAFWALFKPLARRRVASYAIAILASFGVFLSYLFL